MVAKVKPIPDGFHTITPYLIVDDAEKSIAFMEKAFGAQHEHEPTRRPDGKLMHATLRIGDSMLMIAEASERAKAAPVMLYLYVPDVDAAYQKALKAGATSVMEVADQFYGDRSGGEGSGGQSMVPRHPHRGRRAGGAEEACGKLLQAAGQGRVKYACRCGVG
jgi:PhnB protein